MKIPLLATVCKALGFLGLIIGVLFVIGALFAGEAAGGITGVLITLSGIISLGIAEIITLIAAIEYNTSLKKSDGSDKIMKEVLANLKQLSNTRKMTHDLPPIPGHEKYFIAKGDLVDGPLKLSDIRDMKDIGELDEEVFFLVEGSKDWRRISELK